MDGEERDRLAGEVDALAAAVEEERFRHIAGMEAEPSLARLFARWPQAAHRETVARLRAAGEEELALRVAALRTERAQAEAEEAWRAAEAAATPSGPDGRAPLAALDVALAAEDDLQRRRAFAAAAAGALEAAAGSREAAVEIRARAAAEVGLAPDWRAVVLGDETVRSSDDAFREVLAYTVRRELGGMPADGLSRADLLRAVSALRFGALFRPGMIAVALKLTLEGLGLERVRLRIDSDERPSKWPGAHVCGGRVSFRPRGGGGDWADLLAAVGRALVGAASPASRRDPDLGEALSWALGSLALDPRWLAQRVGVEKRDASDVIRDLALRRLFALRADAAAARVAAEAARGLAGEPWREAYRAALYAATSAAWDGVRAARDGEANQLAARARGAEAGEALRRELVERFDEDWWRNPRTSAHLSSLLAAGRLPPPDAPPPGGAASRRLVALLEGAR